jgi:hypothetical protein
MCTVSGINLVIKYVCMALYVPLYSLTGRCITDSVVLNEMLYSVKYFLNDIKILCGKYS